MKDKLGMILDIEKGTLEFEINGELKKRHLTNISSGRALYPSMAAVYGNCEVSMVYHGKPN